MLFTLAQRLLQKLDNDISIRIYCIRLFICGTDSPSFRLHAETKKDKVPPHGSSWFKLETELAEVEEMHPPFSLRRKFPPVWLRLLKMHRTRC